MAIPFLAVIASEFVNSLGFYIPMLVFVVVVSIVPAIVAFTDLVPKRFLPIAIFLVSLSLVLHQALISNYLTGSDVNAEYYFYQQTLQQHHWNPNINPPSFNFQGYSGTTSITIFPAMTSIVTGIYGEWVFKIIFPFCYALLPFVLYLIFNRQIESKPAFLSAFFFAAIPSFYGVDLTLGKQMIATLFMAFFLLVLTGKPRRFSNAFLLLFGMGSIISHYSTGLFLIALLIITESIFWIRKRSYIVPLNIVVALAGFYLIWYTLVSGGFVLGLFGNFLNAIISALPLLLNPGSRYGIALVTQSSGIVSLLIKGINIVFQGLIVFGLLYYTHSKIKKKETSFSSTFLFLSFGSIFFLVLTLALPYFGSYFDVTRLYSLSLLVLAPFGVMGAIAFGKLFANRTRLRSNSTTFLKIMSIFATIFLLFNVGFVSAIAHEPYSTAFSLIPNSSYAVYDKGEFSGAFWLVTNAQSQAQVFMDPASAPLFLSLASVNILDIPWPLENTTNVMQSQSFFFINSWNLRTGTIQIAQVLAQSNELTVYRVNMTQRYYSFLAESNRIYDNGYSTSLMLP